MLGSDSFIRSGSSVRNAKLWITEGKPVGTLGQERRWNQRNPTMSSYPKNPRSHHRSERKDDKKKRASTKQPILDDELLFNAAEPLICTEQEAVEKVKHESSEEHTKNSKTEPKDRPQANNQVRLPYSDPVNEDYDQVDDGEYIENQSRQDGGGSETQLPKIDHNQQASPTPNLSEEMAQNWQMTPQLNSSPVHRKHESLFKHNLEEGLLKRIARRKLRRHVFGEINIQKVNQFGTACSPFHALATTEMQNLTLPTDLPMTPRMKSKGIVCTTESDLKSLQLTFPELDEESAEEPRPSDRKKTLDQTKMPSLPPLVKHSRSQLSENKKMSGCHLPTVPKVAASKSLKWGKY